MKTLISTFVAGGLLAASLLLACSSGDDDSAGAGPSPTPDGGADTSTPPSVDASDAGAADATVSNRPPFDATAPEVTCAVTPCIKSIVAGSTNYCATDSDGVIRCWGGSTALGAFVDGSDPNAGATPVKLTDIGDVVDIGISDYDICVAKSDDTVSCFGSSSQTPNPIVSLAGAKKLGIGDNRRCAVLQSGELACTGDDYSLGQGDTTLNLGEPLLTASLGYSAGFALGASGTIFSWGTERYMLGRTTAISPDLTPAPVNDLPPILQMASSNAHICALAKDGRLFCWGHDDAGGLGLGYIRTESAPVEVIFPGPEWPTQIAASDSHSCARMSDGSLTCWANVNWFGQLGYPSLDGVYIPTKVTSVAKDVVSVAIGNGSTCALIKDGSVQCWGDNSQGQLGRSPHDSIRHPNPSTVVFP